MSSFILNNLTQAATKRLLREYQMLQEDKSLGITVKFSENEKGERSLDTWDLYLEGTTNSLYDGYLIHARISFPSLYPYQPPKFVFVSPIYHPNVYKDGAVCISILHTDQDEIMDSDIVNCTWTPGLNVSSVCISILSLLNEPNIYSAANVDASKEYRDDIESYNKKVRALVQENYQKIKK